MHLEVRAKSLNGFDQPMWAVELENRPIYNLDTQQQANAFASNIAKALKLKSRGEGLWTSVKSRKPVATPIAESGWKSRTASGTALM